MSEQDSSSSQPADAIPVATVYQPQYSTPHVPPAWPSAPGGRRYERPGIITAVGIISIVVAGLSLAGGGISGLYSFGIYVAAQFSASMNTQSTVVTQATLTDTDAGEIGIDGLAERDRRLIGRAIEQVHPLTPVRQQVFDRLLAQSGALIFVEAAEADQSLSIEEIRGTIDEDGVLPSATDDGAGADFFLTEAGRVEVYDTHAVFYPADGTPSTSVTADGTVTEAAFTISAETVDAMIDENQKTYGIKLTDAQRATLHKVLEDPNQQFITSGAGEPASQFNGLFPSGDGQVMVSFSNGNMTLAADGTITQQYVFGAGGFGGGGSAFSISHGALSLVIVGILLSVGLAIYLLVIGILTLRQSVRGRGLHLIYAFAKIPVAGLLAFGWLWLIQSMGPEVNDDVPMLAAGVATTVFAIGVLYPVSLLIVMNLRSVKDYYAAGR